MATTTDGNNRGFPAGADLSSSQHLIVKQSGANVVLASAATDIMIGTLENAPASGDTADVRLLNSNGTAKVVAGGTVAVGSKLTSNASGKAIATTTTGNRVFGISLEAGAADEVVEYLPTDEEIA